MNESLNKLFAECSKLHSSCQHCFKVGTHDTEITQFDSASQITRSSSTTSSRGSTLRKIELEKKRAQLDASYKLLEARKLKAEAEARAQAEVRMAEEEEALASLMLERAEIDAEEKRIACSEVGSSFLSGRSKKRSNVGPSRLSCLQPQAFQLSKSLQREKPFSNENPRTLDNQGSINLIVNETAPKLVKESREFYHDAKSNPIDCRLNVPVTEGNHRRVSTLNAQTPHFNIGYGESSAMESYLERQGRNEYINLASQIGYDGKILNTFF